MVIFAGSGIAGQAERREAPGICSASGNVGVRMRSDADEPSEPFAAREDEDRVVAAVAHHGHDRHALAQRQLDEALAAAEVDAVAVASRAGSTSWSPPG